MKVNQSSQSQFSASATRGFFLSSGAGVLVAVVFALSGTTAFAEADRAKYQLCVAHSSGKIAAKRRCARSETILDAESLAAMVPVSSAAAGPQGPQGLTGPTGLTGPRGEQGVAGPQGAKGEQGPKGDKGEMGPVGPQGTAGAVGPRGAQGAIGPVGPAGAVGARGPNGFSGYEIVTKEVAIGAGLFVSDYVLCPPGKVALGGGANVTKLPRKLVLGESALVISGGSYGWGVSFTNVGDQTGRFLMHSICAYQS